MNKKKTIIFISLIICFQLIVLCSVYLNAVYPVWTGKEIRLKTIPVDPRSLFRGNYAALRYDISRISTEKIKQETVPRANEIVYVLLKEEKNGVWRFDSLSFSRPGQGTFIRGRIRNAGRNRPGTYRITYGIEAYFAPKDKALALEKKLRNTAVAVIRLTAGGKAALIRIEDGSETS